MTLSPVDLDAIRDRVKKTTPGEWRAADDPKWGLEVRSYFNNEFNGNTRIAEVDHSLEDAEFIAHSHEDILNLLAEIYRLRAEEAQQ